MGLFGRLGTLIRSNINELINKAEDPEKMLNQVLVDMRNQLVEAKKQVAVAIADEKRVKKQHQQEAAHAADWERKAMLAVRAGDDTLARAALQRKSDHDAQTVAYEGQWATQKAAVEQLKEALRGLDAKIEEAKGKRNVLVARKKRAEAQQTINDTLGRINSTGSFEGFERFEDRILQLEAEAESSAELSALPDASLESKFKELETGTHVSDDLEALKRKMALGTGSQEGQRAITGDSPGGQGGDGGEQAAQSAEVDAQLEELKRKLNG